jgi:outer membrane biosynthesis protein TonB
MRKTGWTLVLLALLTTAAWTQQEGAAPKAVQTEAPASARTTPATGSDVVEPPACPASFNDSLATDGIVGKDIDGVTRPKPTNSVAAEFSKKARSMIGSKIKNLDAVSILSFVLDVNGNPQDLCLKKPAGYGLDVQAAKAVWQYRFEPATKDGKPVPMRLTVSVAFRTY